MKVDKSYLLTSLGIITLVIMIGLILPLLVFKSHHLMWQIISTLFVMVAVRLLVLKRLMGSFKLIKKILQSQQYDATHMPVATLFADPNPQHVKELEKTVKSVVRQCQQCSIDQIQAVSDLKHANRTREVMLELSHSIINIQDTESLFKLILEKAIDVVEEATHGSFMTLTANNKMEFESLIGYKDILLDVHLDLKDTFLYIETNGQIADPIIIRDIQSFDQTHLDDETFESMEEIFAFELKTTLSSPIFIDGELYGMINIDSSQADAFSDYDILTMKYFTAQTAIAIKNHMLLERTVYLSRFDKLTNTYNRSYFEEIFDEFYKKAKRYHEEFTLVILDLNGLKSINDTYGHPVGDLVIQHFAEGFKQEIRSSDLFARYGGDEFIAIFFHATPKSTREKLDAIITYFENHPLNTDLGELFISFSFGLAHFPSDSNSFDILVKLADERMYEHKYSLKNKLKEYS